jgi:hypothetical protein
MQYSAPLMSESGSCVTSIAGPNGVAHATSPGSRVFFDRNDHTSPGRRPRSIQGNVTFPASTRRRSKSCSRGPCFRRTQTLARVILALRVTVRHSPRHASVFLIRHFELMGPAPAGITDPTDAGRCVHEYRPHRHDRAPPHHTLAHPLIPLRPASRLSDRADSGMLFRRAAHVLGVALCRENELPFNGSFLTDVARPRYQLGGSPQLGSSAA